MICIEACRRHGVRYHHVSTDEVYGDLALDDRTFGVRAIISNCSNN